MVTKCGNYLHVFIIEFEKTYLASDAKRDLMLKKQKATLVAELQMDWSWSHLLQQSSVKEFWHIFNSDI